GGGLATRLVHGCWSTPASVRKTGRARHGRTLPFRNAGVRSRCAGHSPPSPRHPRRIDPARGGALPAAHPSRAESAPVSGAGAKPRKPAVAGWFTGDEGAPALLGSRCTA